MSSNAQTIVTPAGGSVFQHLAASSDVPREGLLAAVDLGSNSFHLIVAQLSEGQMLVLDRLREPVRLAGGLGEDKLLSEEARERALECLRRFGERLRDLPPASVRAVGTNTLRLARDGEAFRRLAERALGHRIEVIAGREEARLIYLGVAHALGGDRHRRLVVDIGGGSTELIIGEGFDPLFRESLYMGCVSMTERFFPGGRIDKATMRQAELAARMEIEPIKGRVREGWWENAVGCSGTIKGVARIVREAGWGDGGISREALRKLRKRVVAAGAVDALELPGLKPDRRPVLVGGVACLWAIFDELRIEHLEVSEMALREGLLYDLHGRIHHEDVRERTLRGLAELYRPDPGQAARVAHTALSLLAQAGAAWELEDDESQSMLRWAAQLHEIGFAVSHNQYHKHGAYLLANSDMAGFSRQEQALLASLVRAHRRKLPMWVFEELPDPRRAVRLCRLLRLAVVLHRGRNSGGLPRLAVTVEGENLLLRCPPGWLEQRPLTQADLKQESGFQAGAGVSLEYV